MSPETKNQPAVTTPEPQPENDTKTLSAPVTERIHQRLASAQQVAKLDKASLVRLAIRNFISDYYQGKGKWKFPKELDFDMIVARDASRCDYNLPD